MAYFDAAVEGQGTPVRGRPGDALDGVAGVHHDATGDAVATAGDDAEDGRGGAVVGFGELDAPFHGCAAFGYCANCVASYMGVLAVDDRQCWESEGKRG